MATVFLHALALAMAAQGMQMPGMDVRADPAASRAPSQAALPAIVQRNDGEGNAQAQADFDQGLTALYAFSPDVGRSFFESAAKADPSFAMAYWGIALSYGPNVNESYDVEKQRSAHAAAQRAAALASGATPADRALIAAAASRFAFTGTDDRVKAARAFYASMRSAAAAFPDDPDVLTLAAQSALEAHPWGWYTPDGTPAEGILDATAWLQTALRLSPSHVGAAHLLIHVTEMSAHPERGLPGANVLATVTLPGYAEHLAHMPAHTYMRLGFYHAAGDANLRALAMQIDVYQDHDADFGTKAYMMSGERARALQMALAFKEPAARAGARGWIAIRFNRCAEAPSLSASPFAHGVCSARTGDSAGAAEALKELKTLGGDSAQIAALVLQSEIARAAGSGLDRIARLQKAVAAQDALGYDEPPQFFYPVRETLGAALLEAGRPADARAVFERDLQINPENPRSLFGLAEALRRLGDEQSAKAVDSRFKVAWAFADAPLRLADL